MEDLTKILLAFIGLTTAIIATSVPAFYIQFKRFRGQVESELEEIRNYHVKDDFDKKLMQVESGWFELDRILAENGRTVSSQLANRTLKIVKNFFHDTAKPGFTVDDYFVAERKIQGIIESEFIGSRKDFDCFTEQEHVYLDNIAKFHTGAFLDRLESLANDKIYNSKLVRFQDDTIKFIVNYRAELIPFLYKKQTTTGFMEVCK
jgi:hypothetical protein